MTRWMLPLVALVGVGCITPRSVGFGQTATSLSPGAAEVGLGVGPGFQSGMSVPQTFGGQTQASSAQSWQVPDVEGNVLVGVADSIGLNLHVSPAGIQPGVKWTLLKGPVSVAVLPAVALGYVALNQSTTTTSGSTSQTATQPFSQLTVLAGLKGIASFDFGLYAGLGYDFEYSSATSLANLGSDVTSNVASQFHNLLAAVGYQFSFGAIHLRPEIAFMWIPTSSNTTSAVSGTTTTSQTNAGASYVYLYPNVTLAIDSAPRR